MISMDLGGRSAVVTGASLGIGAATVRMLADHGAHVIADASDTDKDAVLAANSKSVPLGRYGTAEEVASIITFLCSSAASNVSGAAIEVDGGQGTHV